MFGIGLPELVIILIVALIVFGPKKLPDLAKSLGRGLSEFRKASDDLKSSIESDMKVDLNEEIYNPEVSSQAESLAASESKPPELEGPAPEPGSGTDAYLEDMERGKVEVAQSQENSPQEQIPEPTTPPQKEEDQTAASKEPNRHIG